MTLSKEDIVALTGSKHPVALINDVMATFVTKRITFSLPRVLLPEGISTAESEPDTPHVRLEGERLGTINPEKYAPWITAHSRIALNSSRGNAPAGMLVGGGLPAYLTDSFILSHYSGEVEALPERVLIPGALVLLSDHLGSVMHIIRQENRLVLDVGFARFSVKYTTFPAFPFAADSPSVTVKRRELKRALSASSEAQHDWIRTDEGLVVGDTVVPVLQEDNGDWGPARLSKKLASQVLLLSKKPEVRLSVTPGRTGYVCFASEDDVTVLAQFR